MITERGRQLTDGWKTEGEDGESSHVEGHDSLSEKPLGAPTPAAPDGPMTSSRPMGNKGLSRNRRENRTMKKEKLLEHILEE